MFCGDCKLNFGSSVKAIAHLSSHGHLISEIRTLKGQNNPELRPEEILEPFQLSLLSVVFLDLNQDKESGKCLVCEKLFSRYDEHLREEQGHNRALVQKIEKLLGFSGNEAQFSGNLWMHCVLCNQKILESNFLNHLKDEGHFKNELKALKYHFNQTLTASTCVELFTHSNLPGGKVDDSSVDIEDSASVTNGRIDEHPTASGARLDLDDIDLPRSFTMENLLPDFDNEENGSLESESTTDMTGRCFNEERSTPGDCTAPSTVGSSASSSSYSSTNLSFVSSPSSISSSSVSKRTQSYIKKGFDKETNQVVYICEACKKKMTGEAPVRQHLKAESHKKMVNILESGLSDTGHNFVCNVCNITVSGIDNWNQHLQGKSHKKKEKEFPASRPMRQDYPSPDRSSNATFVDPLGGSYDHSRLNSMQSSFSPSVHPQQLVINTQASPNAFSRQYSTVSTAPAAHVITINIGRCQHCNQVFKTMEELNEHVNTATHMSNQGKVQDETVNRFAANWSGSSLIKCAACGSNFQGWNSLQIHLRSQDHLSKVCTGPNNDVECMLCGVVVRIVDYVGHLDSGVHLGRQENIIKEVTNRVSRQPSSVRSEASFASGDRHSLRDMEEDKNYTLNRLTKDFDRMGVKNEPSEAERSESSHEPGEIVLGEVNYNYCSVCEVELSSAKVAKDHYAGKKHWKKAMQKGCLDDTSSVFGGSTITSSSGGSMLSNASQFVKSCLLIPELKEESLQGFYETTKMVKTVPRLYQHDLYKRIMADDSAYFCYLPTGMGKTLIACLVLSKMLELNPERCFAYFVTDKILLAIQQSEYIKKEFADGVSGHLKIGAICGTEMMLEKGLNDPRKHNILVVTAEYLKKRLENGALKWQEACCVIFDEVHHCDLKHPYNSLIKLFHSPALQTPVYPKLIGLTASPAIKESGRSTFIMLLERLRQFGEAKLVTASPSDIEKHRVIPKVDFHPKSPLPECLEFAGNVGKIVDTFLVENQPFVNALPKRLGHLLQMKDRNEEMNRYYNITIECEKFLEEPIHSSVRKGVDIIRMLLEVIFLAKIVNLYEASVCLEFQIPEDNDAIKTTLTRLMINQVLKEYKEHSEVNLELQSDATPYSALLKEIEDTFPEKDSATKNIFLLILVRTRCDALALTKIMQKEARLKRLNLEVDCVVGHGGNAAGCGVKGMNVKKQFQTLHNIPSKHILVATSVAEEGIDIPGCEKVIMFEAPKDTTAFVQIKGRARKQQSTVILIGPEQEMTKMQFLIASEKFMLEAVQTFNNQNINQIGSR